MNKFILAFGLVGVIGMLGLGCGADNVAACKDAYATINGLECIGDTTVDDSVCDAYKDTSCDVSEYFDCVGSHYKCDGDVIDTAELAKISDCADLATCN